MSDMYRTRTMDQISEGDIGEELKIAGWVAVSYTHLTLPTNSRV